MRKYNVRDVRSGIKSCTGITSIIRIAMNSNAGDATESISGYTMHWGRKRRDDIVIVGVFCTFIKIYKDFIDILLFVLHTQIGREIFRFEFFYL